MRPLYLQACIRKSTGSLAHHELDMFACADICDAAKIPFSNQIMHQISKVSGRMDGQLFAGDVLIDWRLESEVTYDLYRADWLRCCDYYGKGQERPVEQAFDAMMDAINSGRWVDRRADNGNQLILAAPSGRVLVLLTGDVTVDDILPPARHNLRMLHHRTWEVAESATIDRKTFDRIAQAAKEVELRIKRVRPEERVRASITGWGLEWFDRLEEYVNDTGDLPAKRLVNMENRDQPSFWFSSSYAVSILERFSGWVEWDMDALPLEFLPKGYRRPVYGDNRVGSSSISYR